MRRRLRRCNTPVLPSEGVRAVSRYRPIAPKPPVPCVSEFSSSITFQNTYVGTHTHVASPSREYQSTKKGRRRRNKNSETHTPALKRPALLSPDSAREKREELSGFLRGHAADSFAMLFQQDAEFMERAAASAPPSFVLLAETMQSDILGSAVDTFNVDHHNDASGSCIILNMGTRLEHNASEIHFPEARQTSPRFDEKESDEGQDHVRRKSVSLSLPLESPIRALSLLPESRILYAEPSTFLVGSLASSNTNQSCTSIACVERIYGACPEPVILIDDVIMRIVWANFVYSEACKGTVNAPSADRLWQPSLVGQFQIHHPEEGQSKFIPATLWRLSGNVEGCEFHRCLPLRINAVRNDKLLSSLLCSSKQHSSNNVLGRTDIGCSRILVPEPRRPVCSTIRVESISAILNARVELELLSTEQVESILEESDLPWLIADPLNVVRWVNAAYKAMVGQPECPWLDNLNAHGLCQPYLAAAQQLLLGRCCSHLMWVSQHQLRRFLQE